MTAEKKSLELANRVTESRRGTIGSAIKRVSVAALAVGLAGGIALPAVAMNVGDEQGGNSLASSFAGQEQNLAVDPELEAALALIPDEIEATSAEELEEIRVRAEEDAAREEREREQEQEEQSSNSNNSSSNNDSTPPPVSTNAGGIVGTAQSMLGVPYVSGGNTPAGFDCSGFTQWVFAQHGISLPRTTGGQMSVGSGVSLSNAQPGDLIVWGGHVGIYVGNDTMIHSPTPGKTVSYVQLSLMINAMGSPEVRRV
ncbi:MAG TPA: C40 family peptidase [Candidatus Agrococcus pullicola]|uniref:C40 family peptidase n=1 Tax=Candidatus Agrococcus pullicola TaxID=2838429 RepID=A0A9D2C9D7_9MICO|nr:C40 family peptidase [Candidatus Agrococcus pullicola]